MFIRQCGCKRGGLKFVRQLEIFACPSAVLKIPHLARVFSPPAPFLSSPAGRLWVLWQEASGFLDDLFQTTWRTCWREVEGERTRRPSRDVLPVLSLATTEAEALAVLLSRLVRRHFFMFSTMVPTSAVSGCDCQKTEVFKESQVILVQCKKKKKG